MPEIPAANPCLDCRAESSILATLAQIALLADGAASASQAMVSVAGNNVAILPQGTYQTIFIKNTGINPVWIRTGSGAASGGANGEIPLSAESVAGAGDGGSISISTFIGSITAACAAGGSVSVTWSI